MKNGQTPIHIQRWAPADFHGDEHVKLLKARRDYLTLTFYRTFLDESFMAGGSLPAEPEALAAIVLMPQRDVEKALAFCVDRLIFESDGRLHQRRVVREVAEELEFRALQAERGRLGGRAKGEAGAKPPPSTGEATAIDEGKRSVSPPAPAPFASASAPAKRQPALPPAEAPTTPTRSLDPEERDRFWTAVWTAWCTKRGGNGREPDNVEFALARRWLDTGVPLRIVLQGIEDCSSKNLTPSKRLTYVGPAVDEEIARWRRGATS